VGPGILVELVRREAEHREAVLGVRVAQLLQARQLRGEGALGGDVHDQDQTPAVLTHLPVLTLDGEGGEVVEALLVHGLLARLGSDVHLHRRTRPWTRAGTVLPGRPAQARKSSTSARVGALSVPRRVTAIAAAAFARVAADSQSAPRARSASSTPVCVSPAPLVSTGVIGNAGISVPRPWWNTRQPRSPSRTTTTAPGRRCRRIASGVSSSASRSVSALASSAFDVHTVTRASTRRRSSRGKSAQGAPGSSTTSTPSGSDSRNSSSGSRVGSNRLYPETHTRSPGRGSRVASDTAVSSRSAPYTGRNARSADGSSSTVQYPVSASGRGSSESATPSRASASRIRSPYGPVPWAPPCTATAPVRAAAISVVTAPPAYFCSRRTFALPPRGGRSSISRITSTSAWAVWSTRDMARV